ncbi:nucleotidyltransferase domain-containing protein [Glycomyces sp. NRRL B-16210]|uniref:nucleotidyltransferase domain-containing protein n=1 Tax=Glycomyces sp. NRRL B-16210 TaxID=1463821 RepID=UPI0004BF0B93|nr:nucleotidyltransferase domain-containing protein [Glycomyces sp. NRRL B-16210]
MHHSDQARAIADRLAADLAAGTEGIALVGSVANGTDHPHSDIDLILATDRDPGVETRQVDGRLVTLTRAGLHQLRSAFTSPREAGAAVPAWRAARLLHDPHGTLAALQAEARAWRWASLAAAADRWAASELVGLAEEAHKISGMLALDRPRAAAANRLILTLGLTVPLAAAHRLLYDSENDLWDALAAAEGPTWAQAWDTAAGVHHAGHEAGCRAALRLYRLAADRLAPHLDDADLAIVTAAGDLTERT